MKRALTLSLTAGLAVLALAGPASAGGDVCHYKPWKPECQTTTTVADTTTTTQGETTTPPEETTTTEPEETTTTSTVPETTTTQPETTTVPGDVVTVWDAGGSCEAGRFLLTATWGEGIVRVDLYQRIPGLGDFGPGDAGIVPFTESGQTLDATGAVRDTTWVLVPVYENGYDPQPDEIEIPHQVCDEVSPSSTEAPPSTPPATTPAGEPELPFTGPGEWNGLGVAGGLMLVVGAGLVALARWLRARA